MSSLLDAGTGCWGGGLIQALVLTLGARKISSGAHTPVAARLIVADFPKLDFGGVWTCWLVWDVYQGPHFCGSSQGDTIVNVTLVVMTAAHI